jgi:hypothetical protein
MKGTLAFIKECLCLALLPKCPPCDDTAVLLACLTVEDCEIVDICNTVRRFVLSPTTVRYWGGPLFDAIGDMVETFCCVDDVLKKTGVLAVRRKNEERLASILMLGSLYDPDFLRIGQVLRLKTEQPTMADLGTGLVTGLAAVMGLHSVMLRMMGVDVFGGTPVSQPLARQATPRSRKRR